MGEDTTPLARPHNPLDEGTPVQFLRHGSDFSPNDGQSDNHVDHLVQADGDLVPHRVKLSGSGQLYFQQEVSYRGKPHTICGWLDLNPSGQSGPDIEDSSIEFSIAGHDQISVLGRGCNGQAIKDIDFLQPFPDSSSAQDKGDKQSLVDQIDFRQLWYDLQRHKNKPRGQGNQASSSLGQRTGEASNKRKCLHENQSAHRTPSHREQAQRQVLPAIETGEDRKIIDLNPVDQLYDDKNERELDAQPSLSRLNLERARPAPRYAIEIGDSSK